MRLGREQHLDRSLERCPVSTVEVRAPDAAAEDHIADEQGDIAIGRRDPVGHPIWGMARRRQNLYVRVGEVEYLATPEQDVGVVWTERPEPVRRELSDSSQHLRLALGHRHRNSIPLGEICNRSDVVEVAMCEEYRDGFDACPVESVREPRALVARIDYQRGTGVM